MSKARVLAVLVAVVSMLATLNVAATASSRGGATAAEKAHQQAVDFWTVERVRQAKPLHYQVDPATGAVSRAKPACNPSKGCDGGGGGGGGGGGTTETPVSGASWVRDRYDADDDMEDSTGKVLFAFGSSYYVCSASLVSDGATSLVMTAGHCVYDDQGDRFASNWVYIPDYDAAPATLTTNQSFCGQTDLGCWTAAALTTTTEWADRDFERDVAFVRLNGGGHAGTTAITAVSPSHGIAFGAPGSTDFLFLLGYPAAQKYKGKDLTYCAGTTVSDPYGADTQGVLCNMTGGSSGGPWLTGIGADDEIGVAYSVNSYGYSGDSHMYGPIFGPWTQTLFDAAKVDGNELVTTKP